MGKLKERVYNIIREDDENDLISNIFDGIIITLIIINVITVIADTFKLSEAIHYIFDIIEVVSVVVFTLEYILRLWTADFIYKNCTPFKSRLKHFFSFMSMIDLLAILPFYIPFIITVDLRVLRALRIIRLLRIFKVNRYTTALSSIGAVLQKKKSQLLSSLFVLLLLMIISSVLMYSVENEAHPEMFSNALSGLWWAVATFTTVGYGDIYPVTVLGKILSGIIALLGIGLVSVPTGIISAGFIEQINDRKEINKEAENKKYCPYCGHKIDE